MTKTRISFNSTTLIIGAGAHQPYGFPGSKTLTEQIKDLLRKGTPVVHFSDATRECQYSPEQEDRIRICSLMKALRIGPLGNTPADHATALGEALDKFLVMFAGAQVESIDTFLAQRSSAQVPDLLNIKIGKLLIAYFIHKYESQTLIGLHRSDWIQYLTHEFLRHSKLRDLFFSSPPRIYTFNYDNFFEKSVH